MTTSKVFPLVGMHFRPPAKQVLSHLPSGAILELRAEPDNPYDEKAVQVLVKLDEVLPASRVGVLEAELEGTGADIFELLQAHTPPLQLGYIADSDGKVAKERGMAGNRELGEMASALPWGFLGLQARLVFAPDDKPLVLVTVKEEPEG